MQSQKQIQQIAYTRSKNNSQNNGNRNISKYFDIRGYYNTVLFYTYQPNASRINAPVSPSM